MTTYLVTGGSGQVGWELQRALAPAGRVVAPGRGEMDLADPDAIRRVIRAARPAVVLNAAAYTAVDRAEAERDAAMRVNAIAPGVLAEEAKRVGALLVHYSTDYVFDGTKSAPYVESDAAAPLNAYGRSKWAGEAAVRDTGAACLIIRTSWIYAARGANFLRTMLRLARERDELRIVDDQIGSPTWARSIAGMTASVLGSGLERARERAGTYHYASAGAVSWFGFAQAIFREAGRRFPALRAPRLVPIGSADYPAPARRPRNSRLDTTKLAEAFGVVPPRWEAALHACMQEVEL